MELEKRYVPVTVHFDAGGKMRPIEIEFDTCRIRGRESYLWFEKGRWFVAAKDGK